MRRLWNAVLDRAIENVAGIMMLALGFALTLSDSSWVRMIGNFFVASGGVLLSWSLAVSYTKDQALQEQKPRLEQLSLHLGTVSGQIREAAANFHQKEYSADTALALILQSTGTLYTLVNEIQVITGNKFEPKGLIETAERLGDLATNLTGLTSQAVRVARDDDSKSNEDLANQLEIIRTELAQTAQKLKAPDPVTSQQFVQCPNCRSSVAVMIGSSPGDSATGTCFSCGSKFHAHRAANGALFARPWGYRSLNTVKSLALQCSNCKNPFSVNTNEDNDENVLRYCLICFNKMLIEPKNGIIIDSQIEKPLLGEVVREDGYRSIVKCPQCSTERMGFVKKDGRIYANCSRCSRLIEALAVEISYSHTQIADSRANPG
jgi:transcription elongation factor Elf1